MKERQTCVLNIVYTHMRNWSYLKLWISK